MSRTGAVTLFFGEDDFEFRLRIGEAMELQEITDAGLMVVLDRVAHLAMREVEAVLRLGLVGGGMEKVDASRLVRRHLTDGYFGEASRLAAKVIQAAAQGAPDEALGERQGEGVHPSPGESSDTPNSSASGSPAEA